MSDVKWTGAAGDFRADNPDNWQGGRLPQTIEDWEEGCATGEPGYFDSPPSFAVMPNSEFAPGDILTLTFGEITITVPASNRHLAEDICAAVNQVLASHFRPTIGPPSPTASPVRS